MRPPESADTKGDTDMLTTTLRRMYLIAGFVLGFALAGFATGCSASVDVDPHVHAHHVHGAGCGHHWDGHVWR